MEPLSLFLVAPPGLEDTLAQEVKRAGFKGSRTVDGGVTLKGTWADMRRANLELRTPTRVLLRLGAFHVSHLAQLDKLARAFPWGDWLRPDVPVMVEASATRSKLYHSGAIRERIARALADEFGAVVKEDAALRILARIEDDLCTLSVDTSGEPLHKRGHKQAMHKAPLRETLAAAFLMQCGYTGEEPVIDPMCGAGTFVLEAAEMALGLAPGRARSFAFALLKQHDDAAWQSERLSHPRDTAFSITGFDRDASAIAMARKNAARAGLSAVTRFHTQPINALARPDGPPGLVILNPPYGERIGDRKSLFGLYGAIGSVLKERFSGWRVGLVTSDKSLAKATGLPFLPAGKPVLHGGLRVTLFRTAALA